MNLLAVDIGNTNINFGVFCNGKLTKKFILTTSGYNLTKLKRQLKKIKIDTAIVCSVVPKVSGLVGKDLKKITSAKVYIIGKNIHAPIKNLYRKPRQVGQDRLVNAYAGIKLYGAPLVAIDFGTAITFDIISRNKAYLGGMIIPGLGISLNALSEKTALLPKIKLEAPREFIGRDTKNSILSGVIYGFASLTDDLAKRIKQKIGKNAKVIGTGGNIRLIYKYCKEINKIDPELTLKGLMLIYQGK